MPQKEGSPQSLPCATLTSDSWPLVLFKPPVWPILLMAAQEGTWLQVQGSTDCSEPPCQGSKFSGLSQTFPSRTAGGGSPALRAAAS